MGTDESNSLGSSAGSIKFTCPCGKRIRVPQPGMKVNCPKCGKVVQAPGGPDRDSAPLPPADPRESRVALTRGIDKTGKRVAAIGSVAVGLAVLVLACMVTRDIRARRKQEAQRQEQEATAERIAREQETHRREQEAIAKSVARLNAEGDAFRKERRFAEAKGAYKGALAAIQRLDGKDHELAQAIAHALESDDIRYGTDPKYTYFEHRWITKQRKRGILVDRLREAQMAKGLVQFRCRWVKPEEKDAILKQEEAELKAKQEKARQVEEEQKAKGLVKFRWKWVKPEERERILREDEAQRLKHLLDKQPETFVNPIDGSGMVLVPAGLFMMGSNDGRDDDESPLHEVYVDAFYIGKYPVTNRQFKKFVDACPQWGKGRIDSTHATKAYYLRYWDGITYPSDKANHPVVNVSWFAAKAYCESAGGHLPTEAEWEKACRAGSNRKYCFGDSESQLGDYAWYGDRGGSTHPVGQKKPNQWGIYEMHGHVWEWCSSIYRRYPYRRDDGREDISDTSCLPAMRGGSWYDSAVYCRSANRGRNLALGPPNCSGNYGFRLCVRKPQQQGIPVPREKQRARQAEEERRRRAKEAEQEHEERKRKSRDGNLEVEISEGWRIRNVAIRAIEFMPDTILVIGEMLSTRRYEGVMFRVSAYTAEQKLLGTEQGVTQNVQPNTWTAFEASLTGIRERHLVSRLVFRVTLTQ